ncbi:MAG: glycosyltransferase [Acidobacteriaceae bacterium]|nr:glycosyltransferase [Acidobacteriaceae bacterium]
MKIVVFGLSISSAWGNGHATLLRGLFRTLHAGGDQIHFFEKDVPYYANHRDASSFPFAKLHLYTDWESVVRTAARELSDADAGLVTSYCPDGAAACDLVLNSAVHRRVFYDMDTPVTLERLEAGHAVPYLPEYGLGGFDLVLSYTGGKALNDLQSKLSARCVATLYGWVDPDVYHRVDKAPSYQGNFSYLGTYSADRHTAFEQLLIEPARRLPSKQFVVGGAMYPNPGRWPQNIRYFDHVAPPDHTSFYSSCPLTLNITRRSMALMGYCPSGRLFEAAACETAVLSDWWEGLDTFFEPGKEILLASDMSDTVRAATLSGDKLRGIGRRAKERALSCHTADIRAKKLLRMLETPINEAITELGSVSRPSATQETVQPIGEGA